MRLKTPERLSGEGVPKAHQLFAGFIPWRKTPVCGIGFARKTTERTRALTEHAERFAAAAAVESEARPATILSAEALTRIVLASLDDDKAENAVVIDLNKKSSVADAMIVASGRSQRHVGAIADHLLKALKDSGVHAKVEGLPACDWVLIDAGDVVIHLFRPEVRDYYNLEKMWGDEAAGGRSQKRASAPSAE